VTRSRRRSPESPEEKPAAGKPTTDKLAADKLAADKLAADELAAGKVVAAKQAAAKQAAAKPAAARPAAAKPVHTRADERVGDMPAADTLTADKPSAPKPAARRRGQPATENVGPRLSGQLPPGAVRGSGQATTEAGRYLRSAARDDTPARYGSPAGEVDDAAREVWKIAFGLLVRRRFDRDSPLAEISRTVATAVHEHAIAGLPLLDAEMLVRDALGEEVPLEDINPGLVVAAHLLVSATLVDELALGDRELDAIVADAEEQVATLVPA
jgi:hypothetical protein